jgi:hypothetical protein
MGEVSHWEHLLQAFASVPILYLRGTRLRDQQVTHSRELATAGGCSPVILFRSGGSPTVSDWTALDPFGKWPALRAEFENLTETSVRAAPTNRPAGSP